MIIVSIFGGLGNQMFQYACAKSLSLRLGVELKLDIGLVKDRTPKEGLTFREYQLGHFCIPDKIATEQEVRTYVPNLWHAGKAVKLLYRIKRLITGKHMYEEKSFFKYNKQIDKIKDNSYLYGYFQTEEYFKKHDQEIIDIFNLNEPLNSANQLILEQIKQCNAVSLHIRRGDFINSIFEMPEIETYYLKAINIINQKIDSPVFFVFSNDIPWCKANLTGLNLNIIYVDENDESQPYFDMFLMSNCKHHICANSTFSWWGAWLNQHPEKLVIVPSKWYKSGKYAHSTLNLIPKNWLQL